MGTTDNQLKQIILETLELHNPFLQYYYSPVKLYISNYKKKFIPDIYEVCGIQWHTQKEGPSVA